MDVLVTLSGRAKIGGKWRQPGETLTVDHITAGQLEDAGALSQPPRLDTEAVTGLPGFDEAVAAAARDIANAEVEAAVVAAMAEFDAEKAALRARAEEAETEMRSLQARNHELEAEIAELKDRDAQGVAQGDRADTDGAAQTDTPREPAAKTTRKKGAAATNG